MKVICVNSGNQSEYGGIKVVIGSEYTVDDIVYGWQCEIWDNPDKVFYKLKEIENQVYWEGLFAIVSQIEEQAYESLFESKS